MKTSRLRAIPSVEKVLAALNESALPRPTVVAVVRRQLAALRNAASVPEFDEIVAGIRKALEELAITRIRAVINGTGIIVHTNLGRAPLGHAVVQAIADIGSRYNNLEYNLSEGSRGGRAEYLENNLALLCGAEAATVVNNNAAALVLILQHFCKRSSPRESQARSASRKKEFAEKNEAIISRGELIQIGGGFRIPDILEISGARLREIGTTNKTAISDYAGAISQRTALILKVHRSNFYMDGFVESPPTPEIAALARKKKIPLIEDLGSGAVIETKSFAGLEHEPTPAEVLRQGVDLVCFSGDKLLGGPQAGIVAGRAKLISALKREPLFRALRCDKLILAGLEVVVDAYLAAGRSAAGNSCIPVLAMAGASSEQLHLRASKIIAALNGSSLKAIIGEGHSQIGGGTLPRSRIVSVTIELTHPVLKPQQLGARLRHQPVPIVGYTEQGKVKLDLRTIFPDQDGQVIDTLRRVALLGN